MDLQRKEQVQYLLMRWLTAKATPKEEALLFRILEEEKNDFEWEELLQHLIASEPGQENYKKEEWQPMIQSILSGAKPGVVSDRPQADDRHHGVSRSGPRVRQMYWKWIAAACIILVMGYGLWVTVGHKSQVTGDETQVAKAHDVPAPKDARAVITLADGRKVYLDSVNNGTIAQENNVDVVKNENGEIIYSHKGAKAQSEIVYNTLSNPRGSKVISLTLSDGTKVWLNSESSLKYPIAFAGDTREVQITGEAYFEVKHNSQQPFKVHLPNGSIVEDIGTSFNINSYSDEDNIKTTLIEGSVKVLSPAGGGDLNESSNNKRPGVDKGVILKPGEQAVIIPQTRVIRVQNNIDLEKITSWKNNEFNFSDDDIQTIMRQLARWYNIRPVITGTSSTNYTGRITRDVPLSKVLQMFEKLGYVKFQIYGDEVKVITK